MIQIKPGAVFRLFRMTHDEFFSEITEQREFCMIISADDCYVYVLDSSESVVKINISTFERSAKQIWSHRGASH